jgi:hypothetical protein
LGEGTADHSLTITILAEILLIGIAEYEFALEGSEFND